MAGDAKNNKKGFYRYIGQKRKDRGSAFHLINDKVTTDREKAEVLNNFASVFIASQASNISCFPESVGEGWRSKVPPAVRKEKIQEHLMKPNKYKKSMGPDTTHPRVLKELTDGEA